MAVGIHKSTYFHFPFPPHRPPPPPGFIRRQACTRPTTVAHLCQITEISAPRRPPPPRKQDLRARCVWSPGCRAPGEKRGGPVNDFYTGSTWVVCREVLTYAPFTSVSEALCLCVSLCLSVSPFWPVGFVFGRLWLLAPIWLHFSISLSLSLSLCLSVCLSVCLCLCLCVCLSLSLCVSFNLSLYPYQYLLSYFHLLLSLS